MAATLLQKSASAPAGVGNIGVGFDLLGHSIAGLRDRATVRRIDAPEVRVVAVRGVGDVSMIPFDTERNTAGRAVKVLRDTVRQAVQDPEFKNTIDKADTEVAYLDADDFKKFWDKDSATLAGVIKKIGRIETK